MSVYDLLEYSENYLKILGHLYQYARDEPIDNLANTTSFQ